MAPVPPSVAATLSAFHHYCPPFARFDVPARKVSERGRAKRLTRGQAERRVMPGTPDGVAAAELLGQRSAVVRALRAEGEQRPHRVRGTRSPSACPRRSSLSSTMAAAMPAVRSGPDNTGCSPPIQLLLWSENEVRLAQSRRRRRRQVQGAA